ncbi:MAG: TRAP transporter large permease subunit, partial [Candidatus Methanomethylicus sp.]|nr:TRAP transporter large permease subunit [Candidatus Methanomethylicus sp.]
MITMLSLFIGLMLVLFFLGVPIFAALGLTSMAVLLVQSDFTSIPCALFALKMVDGINSYLLLAAPFYVFAASCMNQGSTTQRLFDFICSLVGHVRGGLGHVNILGSMVF